MSKELWAQLVSTTEFHSDPIELLNDKFTIGRAKDNDVCLAGNRFVSSHHCFIERYGSTGSVWLHDTSTNGTLLNSTRKIHGQKVQLNHGDEIFIVNQKDNASSNVAYIYQDIKQLLLEEEQSSNYGDKSIALDGTLPYDAALEEGDSEKEIFCRDSPVVKKPKLNEHDNESVLTVCSTDTLETSSTREPTEFKQVIEPTSQTELSGTTGAAGAYSRGDATDIQNDGVSMHAEDDVSKELQQRTHAFKSDGLEDSLLCSICQDILYNCVSLQPCMHSYCAGCYSEWMSKSQDCPSCRRKVERINTNHIVNNLVEAFCNANPDKKRSEDELKTLDARYHQIKHLLNRDIDPRVNDEADTDDDEDGSESDDDGFSFIQSFGNSYSSGSTFLPAVPINFGAMRPMKTVCRQCSQYQSGTGSAACFSASNVPSTSTAIVSSTGASNVTPPGFTCSPNQTHLLCFCCLQPMPDRRSDHRLGDVIPPQNCAICRRIFCHMYWGCKRSGCHGCLGKFKEFEFGRGVLVGLILNNPFESDIFREYLDRQEISLKNLLSECCARLVAGSYTCSDQHLIANGESIVCFECGLRNFSDLAYQYRCDIALGEMPDDNRPNCYWGRNCRTQKNKPLHAQKFNHVCDQSRTTL